MQRIPRPLMYAHLISGLLSILSIARTFRLPEEQFYVLNLFETTRALRSVCTTIVSACSAIILFFGCNLMLMVSILTLGLHECRCTQTDFFRLSFRRCTPILPAHCHAQYHQRASCHCLHGPPICCCLLLRITCADVWNAVLVHLLIN